MNCYIDNIKELLFEIRTVNERYYESEIKFEGNTKVIYASSCNKNNSLRLDNNFGRLMTIFPLFFSCLDSIIDIENPELVGNNFKRKYNNMKIQTEADKVIKEVYRIMIIIRNVSAHDINSCIFNSKIDINYEFKGTNYILDMSQKGLRLIYGIILTILNENSYPNFQINSYKDGIYVDFYRKILEEINNIQDDKTLSIINIDFYIDYSRDKLHDVKFSIANNKIKFNYELHKHSNINFYINYNNENYVIPQEILDQHFEISLSSIEKWKLPT